MNLFLVYNDYNEEAEECFRTEIAAHLDATYGVSEMVEGHGETFKKECLTFDTTGKITRFWYEFLDGGKIHMMTVHETFINMGFAQKRLSKLIEDLS